MMPESGRTKENLASADVELAVGDKIEVFFSDQGVSFPGRIVNIRTPITTNAAREAESLDKCRVLLAELTRLQHAGLFLAPVDPIALEIPDYFDIVAKPMDLGTVKRNLESNKYPSSDHFAADVRLTFENARTYNGSHHPVAKQASNLLKNFECKYSQLRVDIAASELVYDVQYDNGNTEKGIQRDRLQRLKREHSDVSIGDTAEGESKAKRQKVQLEGQEEASIQPNENEKPVEYAGEWRVLFDDKEEEVLSEEEVRAAVRAYERVRNPSAKIEF
jgi:uncharacterized membrane-anchored protein YhcB (DUF1043 family)